MMHHVVCFCSGVDVECIHKTFCHIPIFLNLFINLFARDKYRETLRVAEAVSDVLYVDEVNFQVP